MYRYTNSDCFQWQIGLSCVPKPGVPNDECVADFFRCTAHTHIQARAHARRIVNSHAATMGVSSKAERRVKPTFQQVLLQLSPFYWQGDASWAWNRKVPFWTGKLFFRLIRTCTFG